jgi:transcriptional regulator with GAF, ATPase, and Fis domain
LVASAGSTARVDGPFRRFPIGARRVGQVAATHEPFVAREALGEFADPLWIEMHRVKSFAAVSLERSGQSRGVLAVFSRRVLSDQDVAFLALTARVAARSLSPAPRAAAPAGAAKEPRATLAQVQREAIERVLIETRGRVSGPRGAALILGLKPSTLVSRMQKLGVRRPQR